MVRVVALALLVAALAGCGGAKKEKVDVVYQGSAWRVILDHGGKAHAQQLVDGDWRSDDSGAVKVRILGPRPGSKQPATPQVAIEMSAKQQLAESALWVDGVELLEKGGGLSPTRGTIYGAPAAPLAKGEHTAVAYARTAAHGTAVAWTFRV